MFQQVRFSLISSPNNYDINLFKEVYIREKYSNIQYQEVEEMLLTFSNSLQTFEPMWWVLKLHKVDTNIYQTLFNNLCKTRLYKNRNIPENYQYAIIDNKHDFHQIQFQYLIEFYNTYKSFIIPYDDNILRENYNIYYMKWIYDNFNISYNTHITLIQQMLKTWIDVSEMNVFDFNTDTKYILYIREQPILKILEYMFIKRPTWITDTICNQIEELKNKTLFYNKYRNIIY